MMFTFLLLLVSYAGFCTVTHHVTAVHRFSQQRELMRGATRLSLCLLGVNQVAGLGAPDAVVGVNQLPTLVLLLCVCAGMCVDIFISHTVFFFFLTNDTEF